MNILTLAVILAVASTVSCGAATLAAFTLPNDLGRNMTVFLLLLIGGLLLLAFIIVTVVAVSRGVTV